MKKVPVLGVSSLLGKLESTFSETAMMAQACNPSTQEDETGGL
jgi:hypothetical protein